MQKPFVKQDVQHHFDDWHHLQAMIHEGYANHARNTQALVEEGLLLFRQLLLDGGLQEVEGRDTAKLMPLNGEERLQFIEHHIHLRHAFIQLAALFEETEKKAARLTITERKDR